MLRFAVLSILFAAVCAVPINDVAKSADVEVIVVDSIDEYLTQNPEIELLERLEKEEVQEPDRVQITYTLGRRVNGDRVVATATYSNQWSTPQQVTSTVRYPANGIGSIVTFVGIVVNQSSNQGQAYVVNGGINQRQIAFVIEARNTLFFRYNTEIYGYN